MQQPLGPMSNAWCANRCATDDLIIADQQFLPDAFVAAVERRRAGEFVNLLPLFEEPRRGLLRQIGNELIAGHPYDVMQARLFAFSRGDVAINGKSQAEAERALWSPGTSLFLDQTTTVANRTILRSHYELEWVARALNVRPKRVAIGPFPRMAMPARVATSSTTGAVVIWAVGQPQIFVDLAVRLLAPIPTAVVVVTTDLQTTLASCISPADAGNALSEARAIVSLSDDPGTAIALAQFGRPLACATHGAAEYLENVTTFDIWQPLGFVDAVLRSLGSRPPMLKQSLDAMAPPAVEAIVNGPLVSVVVTVYNRLGHLRTLLDALARQTYQNVEILVVSNNGPRADAICAGYPNVRYIHREENSGTSAEPRNDGILAASGEYVFVVDDDDVVFPDHIATMMEATSSGVDLLYSNFLIQIVEPSSGDDRILGYDLEKGDGVTPFELNVTNRIGYMTVFAKTDLYRRFGVYDIGRFWGNSETELWMRLSTNVPMAHVDLPTTMYTIRHNWVGSATASMHANYAKGYEEMYREYPAADMPLVQAARANHIAALRSQDNPPPREPRYRIAEPQTR